jgi:uncharacterized protein (TIGR00251 family)
LKLQVKVFPKSSREELIEKDGSIKAYIKAAPDKGKANKALIGLIAKKYKVSKSKVVIVAGLTGRNKVVEVLEG